MGAAIDCEN